jgi:hypothetical protein
MESGLKLLPKIFTDSNICQQIRFGRTKIKRIVENVLSPFAIEKHLDKLVDSNRKFSVSCDASNKNNIK